MPREPDRIDHDPAGARVPHTTGDAIMQYARLGHSGLIVSRLAFGAGSLGVGETLPGLRKNLGQAQADRLVARAIDAGITLFDTSDAYVGGQSELLLGHALGKKRTDIVLTSKCGLRVGTAPTEAGLSRRHILEAVEASLRRLGTDWIDVYHLHSIDPLTPLGETMRACEALIASGKIRYLAVSNWPAWMAATLLGLQKQHGCSPIVAMQLYYSLVGRDIETELVPFAQAAGLGMLVWSPLAGGFLTGKYTRADPNPAGARRSTFAQPPVDLERGYDVIDAMVEIAAARGCTPGHVAIGWLLAKPFVTSIIFGISREEQLDDNLKSADMCLTDDEVATLDALTMQPTRYPDWLLRMVPDPRTRSLLGLS
ncbi:aldo/keto reductase [uncultured Sphingomonas sp.]|uniref:aldo/keto reductase n=1 Tax=uncultured Sphingomonas sp. TaxID=158754 RepID=UPI00262B2E63|nr:aldo/keto reductase [uncultured Sphingomonas sp.]